MREAAWRSPSALADIPVAQQVIAATDGFAQCLISPHHIVYKAIDAERDNQATVVGLMLTEIAGLRPAIPGGRHYGLGLGLGTPGMADPNQLLTVVVQWLLFMRLAVHTRVRSV